MSVVGQAVNLFESRLVIQRTRGNGGEYFYFFCAARQKHDRPALRLPVSDVEDAVTVVYAQLMLPPSVSAQPRTTARETLRTQQETAVALRLRRRAALRRLDDTERRLLDLAANDDFDPGAIRRRLAEVAEERQRLQRADLPEVPTQRPRPLGEALAELANLAAFYRQATEARRRLINRALLERVYIYAVPTRQPEPTAVAPSNLSATLSHRCS